VMIVLFEEGAHTLVARGHDHFWNCLESVFDRVLDVGV
jgi:hypothetical protein